MNFEQKIRSRARLWLPPFLRRSLGNFCGWLRSYLIFPFLGLVFDLSGGRFKANGCSFIIPKNITSLSLRSSFLLRSYEADERRLVQKYILPEDSVLELGACLGILSCITNKLLHDPARHVVVEANPYCLPAIHHNRNRNRAAFLVEHCAVSNQTEVTFYINPTHITSSGVGHYSEMPVRLPGRSLKELTARHGPFSALIMDIEGSELELLESSAETLRSFRLIILELHEAAIGAEGVNRCRAILQQAGFTMAGQSYITDVWLKS